MRPPRPARAGAAALLVLFTACSSGDDSPGAMGSVPMQEDGGLGEAGLDREETLGPFLEAHWRFPIPPQGDPPEGSSALESALDPASCGACHPKQFAEWKGTLHAGAFSPGFAGQLIDRAR